MRTLALIAALLVALSARAETLREFLKANAIPENSFRPAELDQQINGASAAKDALVIAAYMQVQGDQLSGNPRLVRYDRGTGKILRAEVKPEDDECCGSPEDVVLFGDFTIVSFHNNPDAETMMVVDKNLKLAATLYGFDVREIAPGKVVFIENMIHFAPVHPERMELADLRSDATMELYPPKGDALRAAFAHEHAAHMPPHATCEKMNDPCTPELYDESITFIDADGRGTFAFTVEREASHATAEGEEPATVASETALYRYAWNGSAWLYCEAKLTEGEAKKLSPEAKPAVGESMRSQCTPALPVVADTSNADYSPYDRHPAH